MSMLVLLGSCLVSVLIVVGAFKLPARKGVRPAAAVAALLVLLLGFTLASIRHIGANEVGIVIKNIGTKRLKGGAYIAVNGEQGIQSEVLAPGWHFWYWPGIYDVKQTPLTEVPSGSVGIVEARDGLPLPAGQVIAPEVSPDEFLKMVNEPKHFLTAGKGHRGTQSNVLTTGKYRLNTELFRVESVPVTEVLQGEVGVLKANFGSEPTLVVQGVMGALEPGKSGEEVPDEARLRLAKENEMGVRAKVLPPGKYPINTQAYTVVEMWSTQMIAHYTASSRSGPGADPGAEEREITVLTSDGFTFPVDVRIEYVIEPHNAPIVVAKLGDDEGDRFKNALNSAVRAIFRNNAQSVRALDYVQQRSQQEKQTLATLSDEMSRFGVTITAVRIGNVGDEKTLGALLKTQTDREIAKQEQLTFQEQQKAAEQKKLLAKSVQESEEEKRLATAAYSVKIATEDQKKRLIEAEAEAQAITIKAKAQADAYQLIAQQIGKANAALIEVLKIVGERQIQITPRVMVTGERGGEDGESAALIGTMLDHMVSRDEEKK